MQAMDSAPAPDPDERVHDLLTRRIPRALQASHVKEPSFEAAYWGVPPTPISSAGMLLRVKFCDPVNVRVAVATVHLCMFLITRADHLKKPARLSSL